MASIYQPQTHLPAKLERRIARLSRKRILKPALSQSIVSFSFDDCPQSAWKQGVALLAENGWRATFYMAMGLCNTTNHLGLHMSEDEVIDAYENGHEIADHSYSHLDGQQSSLDDFMADIDKNQAALKALGLPPSRNFAYPYGCVSPKLKSRIAPRFELVRGIHNPAIKTANSAQDTALLPAMPMYSGATIPDIIAAIERLPSAPQWLNIFSHDIRPDPSAYGCTPQDMRAIMKAIKQSGARVLPMIEAYDLIEQGLIDAGQNGGAHV